MPTKKPITKKATPEKGSSKAGKKLAAIEEAKIKKDTEAKVRKDRAKVIKKQPVELIATKETIEGVKIVSTKEEGERIKVTTEQGVTYTLSKAEYAAL